MHLLNAGNDLEGKRKDTFLSSIKGKKSWTSSWIDEFLKKELYQTPTSQRQTCSAAQVQEYPNKLHSLQLETGKNRKKGKLLTTTTVPGGRKSRDFSKLFRISYGILIHMATHTYKYVLFYSFFLHLLLLPQHHEALP